MQGFITNGYLTIKSTLPLDLHNDMFSLTWELFDKSGNPRNNILDEIPALDGIFSQPVFRGQ